MTVANVDTIKMNEFDVDSLMLLFQKLLNLFYSFSCLDPSNITLIVVNETDGISKITYSFILRISETRSMFC